MSVPQDVGQIPIFYYHYNTGRPRSGQYRETAEPVAAYWLCHGLTYTSFEYSPVRILSASNGKPAVAAITLTNTGERAGVEVPQMYIRQMVCHEGARPKQELRGFQRVELAHGESTEVRFELTDDVLGYVDRQDNPRVDAGEYRIWIAGSAHQGKPAIFDLTT